MSDKQQPSDWSFKDAIKESHKRAARLEAEAAGKPATPEAPKPIASPPTNTGKPKPLTVKAVSKTSQTRDTVAMVQRSLQGTPRQIVMVTVFLLSVGVICFGGSLIVISTTNGTPTATVSELPTINASDYMEQLKTNDLIVSNVKLVAAPNASWNARQETQFDVQSGKDKGTIIILAYDSARQAGLDAFNATVEDRYKKWTVVQRSNLLLLFSPAMPAQLSHELSNRLMRLAAVPG